MFPTHRAQAGRLGVRGLRRGRDAVAQYDRGQTPHTRAGRPVWPSTGQGAESRPVIRWHRRAGDAAHTIARERGAGHAGQGLCVFGGAGRGWSVKG